MSIREREMYARWEGRTLAALFWDLLYHLRFMATSPPTIQNPGRASPNPPPSMAVGAWGAPTYTLTPCLHRSFTGARGAGWGVGGG